jgi:hypothetical protein
MLLVAPVIWQHCVQAGGWMSALVPCESVQAVPPCHEDEVADVEICCESETPAIEQAALLQPKPELTPIAADLDQAFVAEVGADVPSTHHALSAIALPSSAGDLNILLCTFLC